MIELALLAMFSRLMTWGLGPVIATRTVAADCDVVRAMLSNPANQARLGTGRAVADVPMPEAERYVVPLRVPFGAMLPVSLQVTAPTRRVLQTEVQLRGATVARATWILSAGRATTEVDLAFQLESSNLTARLVMLLGGRWIARRLDTALAALATTSARAAEDVRPLPAANVVSPRRAGGMPATATATRSRRAAVHR
jgi:hypothetical protein